MFAAALMMVVTGAIPLLAIATVCAIEGGVKGRRLWPGVQPGSELRTLAARLRGASC
jgi:hypothetical protein